jgi:adenine phosphoribosyltransferase
LPYEKISVQYSLEYGEATIEMHTDAVKEGMKVLIHDDLLATGGSAFAASILIEKSGGKIAGFNFLVSLDFLNGQDKLVKISDNIINLVNY